MTHNIAIIPARGGSKRIPKKNIIDFDGKPMIAWTIEAAKKSNMFTKVLVSTDCEDIANVSRDAEDYWKIDFDCVAQLMPNCPLRSDKDIVSALNIFKNDNRDFQISCFKFEWMNPWWAFKLNDDSSHEYIFPDKVKKRSQDLDDLFCPTGSIWVALSEKLKNSKTFYGQGHKFQPMSWISATDIDNYEDLDFAKALKQAIK